MTTNPTPTRPEPSHKKGAGNCEHNRGVDAATRPDPTTPTREERDKLISGWTLFDEHPDERRMFDDEVERLFAGEPLLRIAAALDMAVQMAPPQGSYCQTMKISSNEIVRHLKQHLTSEPAASVPVPTPGLLAVAAYWKTRCDALGDAWIATVPVDNLRVMCEALLARSQDGRRG